MQAYERSCMVVGRPYSYSIPLKLEKYKIHVFLCNIKWDYYYFSSVVGFIFFRLFNNTASDM